MLAKDIMSRNVVTVRPNDTIPQAARLMLQKRFSGLPVVDTAGSLIGMVTEGDFLRRTETDTTRRRPRWVEFLMGPGQLAEEYTRAAGRIVYEVMSGQVRTLTEDATVEDVVNLMERHQIKRVPIMRDGNVAGIVTRHDLLRAVARPPHVGRVDEDDAAIRGQILAAIAKQSWSPSTVEPRVAQGVVRLTGMIYDERQRHALRVLVENLPGVKAIEDELVWIEPMSGMVIDPRAA